jgi:class 3 adenylate cyclase
MEETTKRIPFDLSQREFSSIDEYRKKKNTAVLTIMFTDIEGFTALTERKGETYVHALHEAHDQILVETIEENAAGSVIKFIGDSIMAVFAEPTAACEKALLIQRRLAAFNAEHPELDDLKVRIGLHMGQTVIENKIQTDLFGRHVNRASRVESLAAGGHVYITYPVFDSAKSALIDLPGARSTSHGSYFLKGIDRPEEIYEIWNDGITVPEPPRTARKAGAPTKPLVAAIAAAAFLALAGIGLFATRGLWQSPRAERDATQASASDQAAAAPATNESPARDEPKPVANADAKADATKPAATQKAVEPAEVHFLGMIAREPILDFDTPLACVVEDEAQGLKKSVTDIMPGKHVVHYVVSYMVRYYAEFTVKPGKNVIPIKFKESYLPGVDINYNVTSGGATSDSLTAEEKYFLYDRKTLNRVDYVGKVHADVKGRKTDGGTVEFTVNYSVSLNGKEVAAKSFTVTSDPAATEWTHIPEETVYTEGDHYYFVRYEYVGETIQVSVGASFKD